MSRTRPGDTPAVRIEADNEWAWWGSGGSGAESVRPLATPVPQRLITKDDLLAAVWRDAIVSDAARAEAAGTPRLNSEIEPPPSTPA